MLPELIKALARLGDKPVRQTGSHIRLQCDDPVHAITIPNHRPLWVGTLAAIITDVAAQQNMDRDTLIRLMQG